MKSKDIMEILKISVVLWNTNKIDKPVARQIMKREAQIINSVKKTEDVIRGHQTLKNTILKTIFCD